MFAKGWTACVVATIATAAALAGCSKQQVVEEKPAAGYTAGVLSKEFAGTSVHVLMPPWAKLPKSVITGFTERTGIEVKWETLDYDQLHDKIVAMQAAGTAPADILEMDGGWVGQFGAAGWDTDLRNYLGPETPHDAVGAKAFSYQDQQIGVPYSLDFRGSAFNMTMLSKTGITTVPRTYAEVIAAAKAVKKAGLAKYPVGFPLVISDGSAAAWYSLLRSSGGQILGADGRAALTDGSSALDSLQFLRTLHHEGLLDPGSVQLDDGKVDSAFAAGQSAIVLAESPGALTTYASPKDSRIAKDQVVFAHTPGPKGTDGPSLGVQEALSIPKASKHKEAAAMFITWWLQARNQAAAYTDPDGGGGYIPANRAALEDVVQQGKLKGGQQIIDLLDSIEPVIVNGPPTWFAKFNREAASMVQNVAVGNVEPQKGLDDLQAQIARQVK
ncbi:extracellular solute-binding protein [Kribbella sp. NPDC026611]|uniref:extracellular solute-binding protein n=1 Tax=Kribbella sp. NPDC026611 TaxID=3154911 RepID=UPI0033F96F70